ncbi:MAG TPA: hypothetical protein PKV21_06175 [bacterium]|nr:hypothetical protein [bacterium]HOM27076.1 hypothetical protein [bacterium]
MENTYIKKKLKNSLSSYNLDKISFKRDKRLIIENVLNHGGDEEILWVLKNYKKKDIVSVLKNPSRGFWNKKSLNFWLAIFGVKIGKDKYERAIREIFIKSDTH